MKHSPFSNEPGLPPVTCWLAGSVESSALSAIARIRRAEDIVHMAVLPDVHRAADVCVGMAIATSRLIYPSAVGGDIGCGMLAVALDAGADLLTGASRAGQLLRALGESVPTRRHHRAQVCPWPEDLNPEELSHGMLKSVIKAEGVLQLGTLGGGNHFIEFQSDPDDRLWLMIHTGSRVIGQEIKQHHMAQATTRSAGLQALDLDRPAGQAYLADQGWARRYAHENRLALCRLVRQIMLDLFNVPMVDRSLFTCDHNHVQIEQHFGRQLLVHRKGVMPADCGMAGVMPGSMGTLSYHVTGLGCEQSLRSASHGAGRKWSRRQATERISRGDLKRQMAGTWYDPRLANELRCESPQAYKDIRAVLRAQQDLVKSVRDLRPLLVFKGP